MTTTEYLKAVDLYDKINENAKKINELKNELKNKQKYYDDENKKLNDQIDSIQLTPLEMVKFYMTHYSQFNCHKINIDDLQYVKTIVHEIPLIYDDFHYKFICVSTDLQYDVKIRKKQKHISFNLDDHYNDFIKKFKNFNYDELKYNKKATEIMKSLSDRYDDSAYTIYNIDENYFCYANFPPSLFGHWIIPKSFPTTYIFPKFS